MFINNFDPVAIEFFSYEIRWYSIAYIIGILLGWYLAKKIIFDLKIKNNFDDYIAFLIIGLIIGGRLGYVLVYNFEYYVINYLDIFKIWQGGMSFHGGVIGIIISSYFFAKKNGNDVFQFLDLVALVAPIGIFLGRVANFINSELYGHETNVPWAVQFVKIDNLYRHPTQLYEALMEGIVLFLIMIFFWKKDKLSNPGVLSSLFLIFYSLFRFIIEFYRVPDEQLGYLLFNFTMGQIISLIFFGTGLTLYYLKK